MTHVMEKLVLQILPMRAALNLTVSWNQYEFGLFTRPILHIYNRNSKKPKVTGNWSLHHLNTLNSQCNKRLKSFVIWYDSQLSLTYLLRSIATHTSALTLNTFRPRQDGRYFADDVLKCIFLNENVWISLKITLKFVPKGQINNIPALVQIMAWRRPGDKPSSEPMLVFVPTHICVTRPQWVNMRRPSYFRLTRSISWLLMSWLLVSPGYQQPWYWLCRNR